MRPELFFLSVIAMAVVIILWSLNLRHRRQELLHQERLRALEKGAELPLAPEAPASPGTPRIYLLRGLIWLFTGIGLAISLFVLGAIVKPEKREHLESRIWRMERLRRQGVPEEQVKQLLTEKPPDPRKGAEAIAVLGLIPMGVGAAYLIFYSSEEKRLRAAHEP